MIVIINKSSDPKYWYSDKIGNQYEVELHEFDMGTGKSKLTFKVKEPIIHTPINCVSKKWLHIDQTDASII